MRNHQKDLSEVKRWRLLGRPKTAGCDFLLDEMVIHGIEASVQVLLPNDTNNTTNNK